VDAATEAALASGHYIDITTTGRRTGLPRRLEIAIHHFDGGWYISGSPSRRKRAWIANLEADPRMTVHLKGPGPIADLPATGRVIGPGPERERIMPLVARAWRRTDLEAMVSASPLIEVTFDERVA
jgi:deazaflavin-dependent oxidoreductase (nitroreductase family)